MENESTASRIERLTPDQRLRIREILQARSSIGYKLCAKALLDCGIRRLSGVSGIPAYGILREANKLGIRVLGTRRQFSSAIMAGVDNYLSGKMVHAVILSAGPAITEATTGVLVANDNQFPLLVIGCGREIGAQKMGEFQELKSVPIMKTISKWAVTVRSPGDIVPVIEKACRIAIDGIPGPVYVEIPQDALEATAPPKAAVPPGQIVEADPGQGAASDILQMLDKSERPLLCLGEGLRWGYSAEVLHKLVSKLQLPFITTPMGRGLLPDDHPLCANAGRRKMAHRADLFLLAGAWFDWRLRMGGDLASGCKIVHVHPDPEQLGRNIEASVSCCSQPMPLLAALANGIQKSYPERVHWMREIDDCRNSPTVPLPISWNSGPGYVCPRLLFQAIRKYLGRDHIIIEEGSVHLSLSQHFLDSYMPFSRLDPGRNGCIGAGIPQAMGASLAQPERPVFALVGDTGFGMTGMELETAVRHNLDFTLVIANNSGISGENRQNSTFGEAHPERVFQFQDKLPYHEIAKALGVPSWQINAPEHLEAALEAAFSVKGVACVNVLLDPGTPYPLTW